MKVEMGLGPRYSHFPFKAKVIHRLLSMLFVMKQQAFGQRWASVSPQGSDDQTACLRDSGDA